MIPHFKIAAAGLVLSTVLAAGACSKSEEAKAPAAPASAAPAVTGDVARFRIGSLEAISLRDGTLVVPNDNKVLGVGRTPQEVAAVLTGAGAPGDSISLSIQPLLVRTGERLVLIDTGVGSGLGGAGGKLQASLTAAGVDPADITEVLISHSHGDHVGGLVGAEGQLLFPNAVIRIEANEWDFMRANPELKSVSEAILPKVQVFRYGSEVAPGITAVEIAGHTPGHSGFEIVSGAEKLLYIGDAMHSSIISVQKPEWQIAFDNDAPVATASRVALDERAAANTLRLYGYHFPYPGVGRIEKARDAWRWVPEAAPAS
ncbi:MBL fold metallo-hydrolase [Brevundimonas sp. AJA228-03]|uniref:MBL fold metallo-hydrolase n=1 Tax=Brevundimonas sp. AJA228-03 TaxID=2752515 RepID=UPI001AE005BD|nr:MBL fold metallo-hydrolase [Brevundimonas sp. AJA228-03]QTN19589.1 MBL fold metallo-hydrolase [Brevundimonas sp. AJA228-03]